MNLKCTVMQDGALDVHKPSAILAKLEPGAVVRITVHVPDLPRSHPQNALYFSFLRWACRGGNIREEIERAIGRLTESALHEVLKARAGLESTAFATCEPAVFTDYFRNVQERECPFFCGCTWDQAYAEMLNWREVPRV